MKTFIIEQYELYASQWEIKADNYTDALEKLRNGEGEDLGDPEYIEVADSYGLPRECIETKTEEIPLSLGKEYIEGIRSITCEEDSEEDSKKH